MLSNTLGFWNIVLVLLVWKWVGWVLMIWLLRKTTHQSTPTRLHRHGSKIMTGLLPHILRILLSCTPSNMFLHTQLRQRYPDLVNMLGSTPVVNEALADALTEIWNGMPVSRLYNLMSRRVAAVITAEGWHHTSRGSGSSPGSGALTAPCIWHPILI